MILLIFFIVSLLFVFLAWKTQNNQEPVNLWANDKSRIKVTDTRAYNTSCAHLLRGYALVLCLAGILTQSQNILMIILAVLMIVFASLGLMIVYTIIEGRYRL